MSKYCVVGRGFIGKALAEKLGDVSYYPEPTTGKLFYMGGATHPDFDANPDYWELKTMTEFTMLRDYCKKHGIKFIYASSALVYEDKPFGIFKKFLESIAGEGTLGLRIFPVTGPGGHTVIEEWIKNLENGEQPVVWGDGEQTRDFIHIEQVVKQIIEKSDEVGTVDIGTGHLRTFNDLLDGLCEFYDKPFNPKYIPAPEGYIKEGVKFHGKK